MTKSWGSTKGSTNSDKLDYLSFKAGKTTVRIVSGVLPRYVYWIKNKDDKVAAFDCLRFNRDKEKFQQGAKDPVHALGFTEVNDKKETVPLRPKKNYVCWVIDRADGKLKIMEVKATILKGIQSTMRELKLEDPTSIDFVIEKTGKGFDTEYKVSEISAMKFLSKVEVEGTEEWKLHQSDLDILTDGESEEWSKVPNLEDTFPLPSYEDQLENIQTFMEGRKDDKDDGAKEADAQSASEAASDLDD